MSEFSEQHDSKKELKKEEKSFKIIIPHYIINYSLNYNKYILPIYLFIKQRVNSTGKGYFGYNNLLEYFSTQKFNKRYENEIISAIIFLFTGAIEYGYNTYGEYSIINKIPITFTISNQTNIIKNIISLLTIQVNTTEDIIKSNNEEENNNSKFLVSTTSNNYDLNNLIELLIKQLNDNSNIIFYDNTTKGLDGYLLIPSNIIELLEWYCIQQTDSEKNINQYIIKEDTQVQFKKICTDYNILNFQNINLNYILLINLYIFIYRLYSVNINYKKKTTISTNTLVERFSISKTTVTEYIKILKELKLIDIKKGSFKQKISTQYILINKWEQFFDENNDIKDNLTIYQYSIITKAQLNIIKSYYTKVPIEQPKRKRGRPKKNKIK